MLKIISLMTIITKLTRLFSNPDSADLLGVAVRANSLSYCHCPSSGSVDPESSSFTYATVAELSLVAGSVADTMHQWVRQANIQGQCQLILHASQYHIVQISKPQVPEPEIAGALKWQLKDLVPIAPENMVLDYFHGPSINSNDEKINVVCAPLVELKALVEQLNQESVTLKGITIPEFAFANLLTYSDDAVLMVCQQPEEEIFILVIRQAKILFYRHLRGFAQIAKKSEAELGYGIIDSLSLEIQKSVDYFERQLKQAAIREIKVLVPIDNETYLVSKLAENTNVPVSLLTLPQPLINYRPFAAAIGATMTQATVA
jgi:MSHA biogenesis protein MshI